MTKQRRVFSAELKREAVDLVLKQNYGGIEGSRSLGVKERVFRSLQTEWMPAMGSMTAP